MDDEEWAKRNQGSMWDRMPPPIKVLAVVFGALYFVALPLWTVINSPW